MRFEVKTIFKLVFLVTLAAPFSTAPCYGGDPIPPLQGHRSGLVFVAFSADGLRLASVQDNDAVPQPYLIRASDGNVYQISWDLIHPGPKTFSILNEAGMPVVPDENVAVELYLVLLRWDKLPVSIRSNVRSLAEDSIILLKTRLTEPAESAMNGIVVNLAVGAAVGILTGGVSLLPAIVDGFTTIGSVSAPWSGSCRDFQTRALIYKHLKFFWCRLKTQYYQTGKRKLMKYLARMPDLNSEMISKTRGFSVRIACHPPGLSRYRQGAALF